MRRRDFITLLGGGVAGGLAAWPLMAQAPAQTVPVIGVLGGSTRDRFAPLLAAFHQGLGETGYVEGRNVAIEYRWADYQYDQLPALAADLVRRKVSLLVTTGGTLSAQAARAETTTIPLLFVSGFDPNQLVQFMASGEPDPGFIVIDEVAAQWMVLVATPLDWRLYIAAFLLFRVFDIVKPWPVRAIERRVAGGLGIMLDDVAAALYAILLLLIGEGAFGVRP